MRTASLMIATVLAVALGFILGRLRTGGASSPLPGERGKTTHAGLTVERLQPLSSLVTARVDVADVVETTLAGYTGDVRVAVLVKGDCVSSPPTSGWRWRPRMRRST